MIRTQIQLTEDQVNKIKKVAIARHQSVAELIRQAVDSMLKSNTSIDFEERRQRAIAITGKFSSGKSNISREHDSYLAEAFSK